MTTALILEKRKNKGINKSSTYPNRLSGFLTSILAINPATILYLTKVFHLFASSVLLHSKLDFFLSVSSDLDSRASSFAAHHNIISFLQLWWPGGGLPFFSMRSLVRKSYFRKIAIFIHPPNSNSCELYF